MVNTKERRTIAVSHDIKIPSVGESVVEVTIAEWLKKDGDIIQQGDVILLLETDKASVEIAAEDSGVLKILTPKGSTIPVGSLVGTLEPASPEHKAKDIAQDTAQQPSEASDPEDVEDIQKQTEPEPLKPLDKDPKDFSPATRHAMLNQPDHALNLSQEVQTTHLKEVASVPEKPQPVNESQQKQERQPMSSIRRTIAHRLKDVQNTAAILTTFNEVDVTDVMALRRKYQEEFVTKYDVKLGLMSLFIKACVEGLKKYPLLNAMIEGDDIIYNHFYNIGVAVSTPRGLMVPVLRDVEHKQLADIELDIKSFAQKARDGKISIDDLSGGTFTITNGGVFGSMLSTPILNPPQSGILGMHTITARPMVVDGEVKVRSMMYVALSYDHRIVDGSEAVSFLVTVKKNLEDPRRLLLQI